MLLLASLVLGVALRQYERDPFRATYVADALSYHGWAETLATRGLDAEPVFHQPPLFPMLLSALYRALDPVRRVDGALLLQALLTALALAAMVPLGRLYFGSTAVGAAGALLALLHAPVLFYALKLLPTPLALLTQLATLLALARARSGGRAAAGLVGVALGLASLTRGEMLAFVPVAALALWWGVDAVPPTRRARLVRVAWFAAALALTLLPGAAHNLRRGDRVLVASSAGENLFIGNQRGATGGHTPLHEQAGDLFSQRTLARRLAEQARGRSLRPSEVSTYWSERAFAEIAAAPGAWVTLVGRKAWRIVDPGDPTDIYSLALERERYLPVLWALPLSTVSLLLPGLVGLMLALRTDGRRVWPLAAAVGLQLSVLFAFFVDSRLRVGLYVLLAPFAGYALVPAKGRRRLAAGLAVGVLLGALIGLASARPTPRDAIRLAAVLSSADRLDEALAVLEPELGRPAPDALVLDQAGWIQHKRGELTAARDRYRQALAGELPPARRCQIHTRLAQVLERTGDRSGAAREHDAATASSAANAGSHFERGMFRLRTGDAAGAARDFERAIGLDPAWPPPREALAALGRTPAGP